MRIEIINNCEEESSSGPSDHLYGSTLEEVIKKGDEKLEEFHNRDNSEYHKYLSKKAGGI